MSELTDEQFEGARRSYARRMLIASLCSITDALDKNERITDDRIAFQCLRAAAESTTTLVREVVADER